MNRGASTLPPGELDVLLTEFFQREMPDPWPAFEPPVAVSPPTLPLPARGARRSGFRFGSRLALAAAIALLVGATLVLPTRGPTGVRRDVPGVEKDSSKRNPFDGTFDKGQKNKPGNQGESAPKK